MAVTSLESNPCQRATELKALRDQLVTGGTAIEVEFEQGNGNRRRVKYAPADLARLEREIKMADDACSLSGGGRPKRFAIGGRP